MIKDEIKNLILEIFIGLFCIVSLVCGIIMQIIFLIILGIIFLLMLILLLYLEYEEKLYKTMLNNKINNIKNYNNISTYDNLYLDIYKSKKSYIDRLKKKKLGISYLNFILRRKHIYISFDYVSFYVGIKVYKNKIKYKIHTSTKYSKTGLNNRIYNGKRTILINNYTNDQFDDYLIELIDELKEKITNYRNDNQVDSFFNGNLIDKLYPIKFYYRTEGISLILLGTILIFIFIIFILNIEDIINSDKISQQLICYLSFIALIVFTIICLKLGICRLIIWIKAKSDIDNRESIKICGKVRNIKFGILGKGKHGKYYTLKCIKVYVNNDIVIVPVHDIIHFKTKANYDNYIKEVLNKNCNFTCLKKSKVAVKNYEIFVNVAKKILDEK